MRALPEGSMGGVSRQSWTRMVLITDTERILIRRALYTTEYCNMKEKK